MSSYGFGGANAHVVLDDAYHYIRDHVPHGIDKARLLTQTKAHLSPLHGAVLSSGAQPHSHIIFPWSALDENALSRTAKTIHEYLRNPSPLLDEPSFLENMAFTLCRRRSNFTWRSCLIADSIADIVDGTANGFPETKRSIEKPRLAFVFTGQGAQWYAMGRELTSFPIYVQSLQKSQVILSRLGCGWSLLGKYQTFFYTC